MTLKPPTRALGACSIALVALSLLTARAFGSDEAQLDRFRLVLRTGERIDGRNGILGQDALVGQTLAGIPINLQVSDILLLESKHGSKASSGFLLGMLGGGLLFGAIALAAQADETGEIDAGAAVPLGIGLVLVGGGIGAAIGSRSSTWDEVYPRRLSLGAGATTYLAATISF